MLGSGQRGGAGSTVRRNVPLWAKQLAGLVYPLGNILVVTISGVLGFFVIPWKLNWPRWTGAPLGLAATYLSLRAFYALSVAMGLKRLGAVVREGIWEEAELGIRDLLASFEKCRDRSLLDKAEIVLQKARTRTGEREGGIGLAKQIDAARAGSGPG